jgi:hypothetical protein
MPLPQKVDMPAVWTKPAERYETRPRWPYTSNLWVTSQKLITRRSTKWHSAVWNKLAKRYEYKIGARPHRYYLLVASEKLMTRRSTRIALQNEGVSSVHGTIAGFTCYTITCTGGAPVVIYPGRRKRSPGFWKHSAKIFLGPWLA